MCTIWEMAETIRAEERESAARADSPHTGSTDSVPEETAVPGKNASIKRGMQSAVALLVAHRNSAQN